MRQDKRKKETETPTLLGQRMNAGVVIEKRLKHLTQTPNWLSTKTNIPESDIYEIINGGIDNIPSVEQLQRFYDALDVPYDKTLFDPKKETKPSKTYQSTPTTPKATILPKIKPIHKKKENPVAEKPKKYYKNNQIEKEENIIVEQEIIPTQEKTNYNPNSNSDLEERTRSLSLSDPKDTLAHLIYAELKIQQKEPQWLAKKLNIEKNELNEYMLGEKLPNDDLTKRIFSILNVDNDRVYDFAIKRIAYEIKKEEDFANNKTNSEITKKEIPKREYTKPAEESKDQNSSYGIISNTLMQLGENEEQERLLEICRILNLNPLEHSSLFTQKTLNQVYDFKESTDPDNYHPNKSISYKDKEHMMNLFGIKY